jgi:hypothetical protein
MSPMAVIGAGYVELVMAAGIAQSGHDVCRADIVAEAGLDHAVRDGLSTGHLRFAHGAPAAGPAGKNNDTASTLTGDLKESHVSETTLFGNGAPPILMPSRSALIMTTCGTGWSYQGSGSRCLRRTAAAITLRRPHGVNAKPGSKRTAEAARDAARKVSTGITISSYGVVGYDAHLHKRYDHQVELAKYLITVRHLRIAARTVAALAPGLTATAPRC